MGVYQEVCGTMERPGGPERRILGALMKSYAGAQTRRGPWVPFLLTSLYILHWKPLPLSSSRNSLLIDALIRLAGIC